MKKLNLSYLTLILEVVNDAFKFHSLSLFNSSIYLYFSAILEGYSQPKKIKRLPIKIGKIIFY